MAFDFAASLASERELGSYLIKRFILSPSQWAGYANPTVLRWKRVKFSASNVASVPSSNGVYSFVVDPEICNHPATHYLLYIGRARGVTLRGRFGDYLREQVKDKGRPHMKMMLNKWKDHLWFYYAEVPDASAIDALEEDLLAAYLPPFNRSFPATIREVIHVVFA